LEVGGGGLDRSLSQA